MKKKLTFKQLKIARLKARLRRLLKSYDNECDKLSCGRRLAEEVNPRVLRAKVNFNKTVEKLRELDPTVPDSCKL